jgi:hypothetical protein
MKTKTTKTMMILVAILFSVSGSVWAMDYLPPAYRGGAFSTTQEWDFITDGPAGNYAAPDGQSGINNTPYGNPGLLVLASSGYNPALGLEPGGAWLNPDMDMRIYNAGTSDPGTSKDVRVQVTYGIMPGITLFPPIIDIPFPAGASPINQQTFPLGLGPNGINWFVAVEDWEIIPNPSQETVQVLSGSVTDDMWISEIVVDTIHYDVPEPATICVLGLGALALRRKRRIA